MTDNDAPRDEFSPDAPGELIGDASDEVSGAADDLPGVDFVESDITPTDETPVAVDTDVDADVETKLETKTVYRGSGVRWGFVIGLVLAVLLVILVFQNTEPVSFSFLIWDIRTPLAALLIATAVIAAVADELVGLVVRVRRRRRLQEKEELEKLRQRTET